MPRTPRQTTPDPLTGILEAIRSVQAGLPGGLPRGAYREALAIELGRRGIGCERNVEVPMHYKGIRLQAHYRVDLVCAGTILVLVGVDRQEQQAPPAWLAACLAAGGATLALAVAFGGPQVRIEELPHRARARLVAEGSG